MASMMTKGMGSDNVIRDMDLNDSNDSNDHLSRLTESKTMFNRKGGMRPIREQQYIACGLSFFKLPPNTLIDEERILKTHFQMEEYFGKYERILDDSDCNFFRLNDFIARVLIATCQGKTMQEANIMPFYQFEELVDMWMQNPQWKSFNFNPEDDRVSGLKVDICPFDLEQKPGSLFAADLPGDPGNRTYVSLLVSDRNQGKLNIKTSKKINKLMSTGSDEDLIKAISFAKGTRELQCRKPMRPDDKRLEKYFVLRKRWQAFREKKANRQIKGLTRKSRTETKEDESLMSRPPASIESFKKFGFIFTDQYTSFPKFECTKKSNSRQLPGITIDIARDLFDESTESNFEPSVIDQMAMFMVTLYLTEMDVEPVRGSKSSLKSFSERFFKLDKRTNFFGSSGNMYLQCTKLAVSFQVEGVRKVMPYVLFVRYLHNLLEKSIDYELEVFYCLNGCPKKTTGNLTCSELLNHYSKSCVECFFCMICGKQFAVPSNFAQHFSTCHVKKGEYQDIIPLVEEKFIEFYEKGYGQTLEIPFCARGHPLYRDWERGVPDKYPCPLYTVETAETFLEEYPSQ